MTIWHFGRYQWCSTCKGIVKYPDYLTLTWPFYILVSINDAEHVKEMWNVNTSWHLLWPYHISAGINDTVHVKELWHVKITWHLLWPHDISVLKHVVCPVSLTILDFSGTTYPIGNVGLVPVRCMQVPAEHFHLFHILSYIYTMLWLCIYMYLSSVSDLHCKSIGTLHVECGLFLARSCLDCR